MAGGGGMHCKLMAVGKWGLLVVASSSMHVTRAGLRVLHHYCTTPSPITRTHTARISLRLLLQQQSQLQNNSREQMKCLLEEHSRLEHQVAHLAPTQRSSRTTSGPTLTQSRKLAGPILTTTMEAQVASNASAVPSAMDLLMVFPRLAQRAGLYLPETVEDIMDKVWNGGSSIAQATAEEASANVSSAIVTSSVVQETIAQTTTPGMQAAFQRAWVQGTTTGGSSIFGMIIQAFGRIKNFGGIFSYLTSRWALATFIAAVVLNRAQFYASSREHLRLKWFVRMGVYAVPIGMVLRQLVILLEALRCQTSPDFALLRYGDPLKSLSLDFGGDDDILYRLSSTLAFWKDDAACCAARNMSVLALDGDTSQLRGSMSLLFVFFLTLCASQLFETMACALQGRQPVPETGMTIFEHSLAFAECEAMISSALGLGFFGLPKSNGAATSGASDTTGPLFTRAEILQRLNVPPEVLLVCLISCFSHLSSALLAVTGLRDKVRLINTGIWACCYMSAFVWSFARIFMYPIESVGDLGVLRFPTVCVVGFIPHLVILIGILFCSVMYGMALLLTALNVPDEAASGMSFRQRFSWAYSNLQANVQFSQASAIRIKMSEDFYTTLLKVGFSVLTAASEAVYLNEGSRIQVAQMTWLERKRIDEFVVRMDNRKKSAIPAELLGEEIAKGVDFIDHENAGLSKSPYARERKSRPKGSEAERADAAEIDSGLGIKQKRSRMHLTCDFITGVFWLSISLQAHLVLDVLQRLGISTRPRWLLKAAGVTDDLQEMAGSHPDRSADNLQFWMVGPDGNLRLPRDRDVDVEAEMRRKHQRTGTYSTEEALGDNVYSWWRSGGWFGDVDNSGDYQARPADDDDDVTSMISMSSNASVADDWSDAEEESGRRTPTQREPYADRSREVTPSTEGGLDVSLLSRLLNPQSVAEREEARLLSHSLQTDRPMTRAQFRRTTDRQNAQLLRSSASAHGSLEDEEHDLEQFILMQRSKGKAKLSRGTGSWENGAEGMGEGGPQCVVCQTTPRTVLVWPCGCLSMCDDCRVGLAARNYTKCICCRTDVAAYSRLYVP
jgi:hypothetical protein